MKLIVSWTNNEPTANQRVYATDPTTMQRKLVAEVAAGLSTTDVDLDTLPNGPIAWPSFFTVVSVKDEVESAEASAKVLSIFEEQTAVKFAAVMDAAGKFRPEVLPEFTVKSSSVPDAKFSPDYAHFVVDGAVYQAMGSVSNLFDPRTLASVPNDGYYNVQHAGVEGTPFRGGPGEFFILGDSNDSEKAWKWDGTDLTLISELATGKTGVFYRHTVMGHNGKIYRFGGIGSVADGKLLISTFDTKTNTWEVIREDLVTYQGNGADVYGAIDYNGMLVIMDTTYKRYILIDTKTGDSLTDALDEFAPLSGLTARTIVGGDGVIYALNSAKQLIAIFLSPDGQIDKIEPITGYDEASNATCMALAVTGELVIGTQDGRLVLLDVYSDHSGSRQVLLPDAGWVSSIFRCGNDLTVIAAEKAYHVAIDNYPVTFDVTYEQVRQGATNYIRQI